jgi:hypothetical protein
MDTTDIYNQASSSFSIGIRRSVGAILITHNPPGTHICEANSLVVTYLLHLCMAEDKYQQQDEAQHGTPTLLLQQTNFQKIAQNEVMIKFFFQQSNT